MVKREDNRESRAQPNQRIPKDHFAPDGLSNGPQTGAVRKSWDAEQGPRPQGEQRK
jgi:hypothetical protein